MFTTRIYNFQFQILGFIYLQLHVGSSVPFLFRFSSTIFKWILGCKDFNHWEQKELAFQNINKDGLEYIYNSH